MVNFKKIHQLEKKTADKVINLAHSLVLLETEFLKGVKHQIREINSYRIPQLIKVPTDRKTLQTAVSNVSNTLDNELEIIKVNFNFFLLESLKTIADQTTEIIKPLKDLQEKEERKEERRQEQIEGEIWVADQVAISKVFKRKWIGGKNWLDRLNDVSKESRIKIWKVFREGLTEGLGYKEITRNIRKAVGFAGTRIERIVRTEGQRIQNDIIVKSYHRNRKWVAGIQYTATLDGRTCQICGSYDRTEYFWEKLPSAYSAPYIPRHPLCRCVYVPITRIWEKLGTTWPKQRASQFGPTTGNYESWLKRQEYLNPGFAKKVLGKNYSKWVEGKYNLRGARVTPKINIGDYMKTEKKQFQKEVRKKRKELRG